MGYSVQGFNQEVAVKLELDCMDLMLLRWLIDFSVTSNIKSRVIDDTSYYWINYELIETSLPILNISKKQIGVRLRNLALKKVLKHKTIKSKGIFSYYSFDENMDNLIYNNIPTLAVKTAYITSQNCLPSTSKLPTPSSQNYQQIKYNNIYNIDNNNIDNNNIDNNNKDTNIIIKSNKVKSSKFLDMKNMILTFSDNLEVQELLNQFLEIRKKKGLEIIQFKILLEDFKAKCKTDPEKISALKKAISRGWKAIVYEDTFNVKNDFNNFNQNSEKAYANMTQEEKDNFNKNCLSKKSY